LSGAGMPGDLAGFKTTKPASGGGGGFNPTIAWVPITNLDIEGSAYGVVAQPITLSTKITTAGGTATKTSPVLWTNEAAGAGLAIGAVTSATFTPTAAGSITIKATIEDAAGPENAKTNAVGTKTITVEAPHVAANAISAITIRGIKQPVTNESAADAKAGLQISVTANSEAAGLAGTDITSSTWKEDGGAFAASTFASGKVYSLDIVLKDTFLYDGIQADGTNITVDAGTTGVAGSGGKTAAGIPGNSSTPGAVTITIKFDTTVTPPTAIPTAAISFAAAALTGATLGGASPLATTAATTYEVTSTAWDPTGTAAAKSIYTATVVLTAKDNNYFNQATWAVNAASSLITVSKHAADSIGTVAITNAPANANAQNSVTIEVLVAAGLATFPTAIPTVAITIPELEIGEAGPTATVLPAANYTIDAQAWTGLTGASSVVAAEDDGVLTITLKAKPNYYFDTTTWAQSADASDIVTPSIHANDTIGDIEVDTAPTALAAENTVVLIIKVTAAD